jgi:hypothetical protein
VIKLLKAFAVAVRNIIIGGNLVSLSLLTRPRMMLFYITQNLFLLNTFDNRREIPQRNVFEVLPAADSESITLGNLHSDTWLASYASPASDIISLCFICRLLKPKVVFEIGTLNGYTALHFALNTSDDARIFTLDLPKINKVVPGLSTTVIDDEFINSSGCLERYCFDGTDVRARITCLNGDSSGFDYSPYHRKVDFFFVDGAHSYEYARADTLNALVCCHPGSVIAWHDYGQMGMSGVSQWLHEFSRQGHEIYSVPGGSVAFMVVK